MDVAVRPNGRWSELRFRLVPTGGGLSLEAWRSRHHALTILLWLHIPALALFGLFRATPLIHLSGELIALAGLAALATFPGFSSTLRSIFATVGLTTCSALLVHFSGGVIEAHFHFFIVVPLIALYQDWRPFLVAVAYVVLHHGFVGTIAPQDVYNHPAAIADPLRWAGIHGLFVLGEGIACIAAWRITERSTAVADLFAEKLGGARSQVRALASIVESHIDPIIGCKPDGTITSWNTAAQRLMGWDEAAVIGRGLTFLVDDGDAADLEPILIEVARGVPHEHILTKVCAQDGTSIDVAFDSLAHRRRRRGHWICSLHQGHPS